MKNFFLMILASVLLGALAYSGIFLWQKRKIDHKHAHSTAFEWLSAEFQLNDGQRHRIESLHKEHFPECEDHCIHYTDTRHTLAAIADDPNLDNSPEHIAAAHRLAQLEKEADKNFIDFVYAVASEMEPEQSRRYLQKMKGWLDMAGGVEQK